MSKIFVIFIILIASILCFIPEQPNEPKTSTDGPIHKDFEQTNVIVLTQPATVMDFVIKGTSDHLSYVPTSYVKYVEQSGAVA